MAAAQDLVVFAASSLAEAFEEIAARFEADRPGVRVELSFGGSSMLAAQIVQGAPADVFASADEAQMRNVADQGLLAEPPARFASNELVIAVADGAELAAPGDLTREGLRLVLVGPEVPAGAYARHALAALEAVHGDGFAEKVLANLVSEEPNVRQAMARVTLGEADAAVVYATDALATRGVRVVGLGDAARVGVVYPIAALGRSAQPELAQAFVRLVLSPEGRSILAARGFLPPE